MGLGSVLLCSALLWLWEFGGDWVGWGCVWLSSRAALAARSSHALPPAAARPQNVLAVGLGTCVYLWSACTSKVTRLVDLGDAGAVCR